MLFRNITFSYDGEEVLNSVSFYIKKGEKIALIGKNGSGKSTISRILSRLNIPDDREILVDGVRISEIAESSYFDVFAFTMQTPMLFDNTVMYNLKYSSPKISDDEIYEMSKKHNLHTSIMSLKNCYYTRVGERGQLLSAAECQKVILLRALLHKSDVLVMVEPTSSFDQLSEL